MILKIQIHVIHSFGQLCYYHGGNKNKKNKKMIDDFLCGFYYYYHVNNIVPRSVTLVLANAD